MADPNSRANGHRIFAAFYDQMLAPVERSLLGPRRAALLGNLSGRVIDVGAGTGANLPFFRSADEVLAVEPDPAMRRRLAGHSSRCPAPMTLCAAGADDLPVEDGAVDAVVFALVLCTVPEPVRALAEARRVLRRGGTLVALEHVVGHGRPAAWRRRLDPLWTRMAAGCHLDRDTESTIRAAGFELAAVEHFGPTPSWGPIGSMVQLTALR
ncbi:methyltransferase family protein [Pseudonocardia sediminis]|uniref:Methyltransferase family protein n=1 Tax=Pseudonocardia sediminis TaxID=1397368 RepID=A0A4Q7U7R7_PSEST|nr:class I SAM-dependent methyltransferase [Pseudonocardia sediminis]RZT75537.1 methyltransferase family protein [Pseudonocardia sediminis]